MFRVQGMIHHFIDTFISSNERSTNLQLYFYETENELPNQLDTFISSNERSTSLELISFLCW